MSGSFSWGLGSAILLLSCILLSGCTSSLVGDVTYHNGNVTVEITSPVAVPDSYLQITIHEIKGLHQEEIATFETPVNLVPGKNYVAVSGLIGPGDYKLYVYLLQNGTRKTAVIRDIRV